MEEIINDIASHNTKMFLEERENIQNIRFMFMDFMRLSYLDEEQS